MTFGLNVAAIFIVGVLTAVLILFIFYIWKSWHPTSNAANPPKKTLGLLSMLFLGAILWVAWKFQPWMPEGRAVHVGDAHFGNHDFQVWQRKNSFAYATEPFATALFVRKTGDQWKAYLLDIQDIYRPSISLREENSGVAILYGKTKRAYFDEERDVFTLYHWDGGSNEIEGIVVDSAPPGNWRLKESSAQ